MDKFISHFDGAFASEVSIGMPNPENLTQEEFYSSSDLLYHGAAKNFQYHWDNTLYTPPCDTSSTLGIGLYCTDDLNRAKLYASLRSQEFSGSGQHGYVAVFIPKLARMLDFRNPKGSGNRGVPIDIVKKYIARVSTLSISTDNWWENPEINGANDHIGKIQMKIQNPDTIIDLRELLQTGIEGKTSTENFVWENLMRELGFDGCIYIEGGEGAFHDISATSYIFYNPTVVGTYDNWKNKQKTKETVEKIINPPLA